MFFPPAELYRQGFADRGIIVLWDAAGESREVTIGIRHCSQGMRRCGPQGACSCARFRETISTEAEHVNFPNEE